MNALAAWITTVGVIYVSYTGSLGITKPWQSVQIITQSARNAEEVAARIHQRRVEVWRAGTALSAMCSEMYCLFLIIMCLVDTHAGGPGSSSVNPFYTINFWTAMVSSFFTRWTSRPGGEVSREETMIVSLTLNVIGMLNSIDLSNHLVPCNYLGRAFVGSFSPDITFTVRVNIFLVPLFVFCGYLRQDATDLKTVPMLLLNEVVSVVFMSVILGQLHYLTVRQEQSTIDLEDALAKEEIRTNETNAILKAAKGILAVTCDCCEQLSEDWVIMKPSQRILEMFRFPRKEKPPSFSLLECISVEDQDRFKDFIAKSDVTNTAPSSLHLHMKDFSGGFFDVQIFHMPVPSAVAKPQHLVGFIMKPDTRELRPAMSCTTIPEGHILEQLSSSSEGTMSLSSYRMKSRIEEAATGDWKRILESLDSVEHIYLTLDLHTSQEGYGVRHMEVDFKEPLPTLYSLMKRKQRVVVEDWLQEHVNCWYHKESCAERCAGTKLSIPQLGSIVVGDMSVESITMDEDSESFTLTLEMRQLRA